MRVVTTIRMGLTVNFFCVNWVSWERGTLSGHSYSHSIAWQKNTAILPSQNHPNEESHEFNHASTGKWVRPYVMLCFCRSKCTNAPSMGIQTGRHFISQVPTSSRGPTSRYRAEPLTATQDGKHNLHQAYLVWINRKIMGKNFRIHNWWWLPSHRPINFRPYRMSTITGIRQTIRRSPLLW